MGKKNKSSNVTRRTILKSTASALVAAPLLAGTPPAQNASAPRLRFFTPDEFAMVDELTEIIIPTDDHSPGARAAQVAAYIDAHLAEAFTDESRQQWRAGLQLIDTVARELSGKPFLQASAAQQLAVVTRIAQGERTPNQPAGAFFVQLKQQTIHVYYTSKIGIQQEMEYKGNVYLKEYVGESLP
ncbi:MAG: gluconate 2-dehydrogenase subunit 3 family protein [Acidobacteria bacterium]|nr:gluconate 2-dehydrogenase subunit 3 family protein [Acidobacteriota bacterium]